MVSTPRGREPGKPQPGAELGLDQFESVPDDQGISLEELSAAYAQLLGKGADPYQRAVEAAPGSLEEILETIPAPEGADDICDLCPRSIVEAMLFVGHPGNDPLTAEQIAQLMRGVPVREVEDLVRDLNQSYAEHGHAYQIVSVGSGYRLELRDEFAPLRNVFSGRVRETRLSQAAVDVLAIVAYQQGLTRAQIEQLRGRPCGAILAQLVRRRLLRLDRPAKKPRTPRYSTSERFLELFGLRSLDELPLSQDLD
jgi:segregation and condensation protein B